MKNNFQKKSNLTWQISILENIAYDRVADETKLE